MTIFKLLLLLGSTSVHQSTRDDFSQFIRCHKPLVPDVLSAHFKREISNEIVKLLTTLYNESLHSDRQYSTEVE